MRLREFDVFAPELSPEARHQFQTRARCITSHYERCFPGLVVDRAWKVLVEFVTRDPRTTVQDLLGVFTIQVVVDVRSIGSLSNRSEKAALLEALHQGVLDVARAKGWPREPFMAARKCVLEHDFVNEWRWGSKWSPGRKLRAELACEHTPERFRASLEVFDKKGSLVGRQLAFESMPHEFAFVPRLGKLQWLGASQVALLGRDGERVASFTTCS